MIIFIKGMLTLAATGAFLFLIVMVAGAATTDTYPCMEEIEMFCKDVQPGGGRILECLNGHANELSPVCRNKLDQALKRVEEAKKICSADIAKFCADVKPGQGRLLKCLKGQEGKLTQECREQVVSYGGKPAQKPATGQ